MFRFVCRERTFFYALFLLLNMSEMVLELTASRVMSPYFGTSLFVWTAIIGIILFAASIGNLVGGKLSERKEVHESLWLVLIFSAWSVAIIPLIVDGFFPFLLDCGFGVRVNSMIASILLFLVPSILISIGTPFLMKAQLTDNDELGNESGRIHALIAIGSLAGTFLGGFVLIPLFGTDKIILTLSGVLFILSLMAIPKDVDYRKSVGLIVAYLITCGILIISFFPDKGEMRYEKGISIDTEYSRILIKDVPDIDGRSVRLYKSSGAYSSGMFLDDPIELVFDYTKRYEDAFEWTPIQKVLMIGGAAYSYPKYYIAHHSGEMTVVEIDPKAKEIAKTYFHLQEVIEKYDKTGRLKLITADGRVYLNNSKEKYDAVFNDAFSGEVPVGTLATQEAVKEIYGVLTEKGVYVSNVIGSLNGTNSWFLRSEIKTIASVFPCVYVYRADLGENDSFDNYMIVGSKKKLSVKSLPVKYRERDFILTDNYSPVDQMVGDSYMKNNNK